VALAAGFGLDLERCDPEVFDALYELLEEQGREQQRAKLEQDLRAKMGR
jgi:hypothetical protein